MKLRTRLVGVAGVLALSGGMLTAVALPAGATVTPTGHCGGALSLTKLAQTANSAVGLTDQTSEIKAAGAATTDSVTKAKNGGTCTGTKVDSLSNKYPSGAPPATLTPKAIASVLQGASSCAIGSTAQGADANNSKAYTLTGKITYTMNETYVEPVTNITKPYKLQAQISVLGFDPNGADVIDISGIVLTGVSAGSNVSGSLWEDPAQKAVSPDKGDGNSGYRALTSSQASVALLGCIDGTPNNVQMPGAPPGSGITTVLVGDGSSPTFSSPATGLSFQQGQ